ncbi:AAA family ATPase [Novosphingobium sp. EMRT-2]|uniref:AAA family ATPase n=2 Tax=Novosphingobium sp. EMRT-2 TaxID=2571749 RepID=UPI0010BD9A64|nr:AAA family ATPase [Novosphingobium sp. EMRT-2]QCI92119.1 hypothetical protein FA702_00065 [Novosphingobium sp. EMRT-2]
MGWADLETSLDPQPLFRVEGPDGERSWSEIERVVRFRRLMRDLAPAVLVCAIPNAGRRNPRQARREGIQGGAFDYLVAWGIRQIAFPEFKGYDARGRAGTLSDAQIDWGNRMYLLGHHVGCFFRPRLRSAGCAIVAHRSEGASMASAPDLRSIAAALGGEVSGNRVLVPTDGHSKRDRGTVITLNPDAPDGVLVHSFNGGDALAVKDELRRHGLLPERPERQGMPKPQWRETGCYEYDDGVGNTVYRTKRLEATGHNKRFVAERFEAGRWVNGLGALPRVLYRLTDLQNAVAIAKDKANEPPLVYFVEGERKADKLISMGFVATAIAFGANGWQREYADALAGLSVVVLPDNDDPGRKFAETVKAAVEDVGGTACIVDLPGLPAKGDIMDWNGTADDLRTLTDKALSGSLMPLPMLDLAALASRRAEPVRYVIERIAPEGEVTLLYGPGSAGKSLLGQQFATCAAAAIPCLGLSVASGPAIYLTCEDDENQLHWRQQHLCEALGIEMSALSGKLFLSSLRGELGNELANFSGDGQMSLTPAYHRLVATLHATGARLIILDNVAHLFTGNENDRGDVTRFVNVLNRLAMETGAAIILVGHPNKAGDEWSGSTAWNNAVRSRLWLEHDEEADVRTLSLPKANYSQKGDVVRFRWLDWAFVRDEDIPQDRREAIDDVIRANAQNAAFLACLDIRNAQERPVSESPASRTYAPKEFAAMDEAKGFKKPQLEAAMDRLFRNGEIEVGLVCRTGRKDRFGVRRVCADLRADPAPTPCADPAPTPRRPAPPHTPYTTYREGEALGAASPSSPDGELDWSDSNSGAAWHDYAR